MTEMFRGTNTKLNEAVTRDLPNEKGHLRLICASLPVKPLAELEL